jgi:hypothetical protein
MKKNEPQTPLNTKIPGGLPKEIICFILVFGLMLTACNDPINTKKSGKTYKVSFHAGLGSGPPPSDIQVEAEKDVTLPSQGDMRGPENRPFTGWKLQGGDDTLYPPGSAFTVLRDITFVAQWAETNTDSPHPPNTMGKVIVYNYSISYDITSLEIRNIETGDISLSFSETIYPNGARSFNITPGFYQVYVWYTDDTSPTISSSFTIEKEEEIEVRAYGRRSITIIDR